MLHWKMAIGGFGGGHLQIENWQKCPSLPNGICTICFSYPGSQNWLLWPIHPCYIYVQTPSLEGPMNLRCFFTPKAISIKKPWVGVQLRQPKKMDMIWFDIHVKWFQKKHTKVVVFKNQKTTKLNEGPLELGPCFIRAAGGEGFEPWEFDP